MAAAVALALALAGCGRTGKSEEVQVRGAYAEYDAAVRSRNLEALRAAVTGDKAVELARPEAPQILELAASFRPKDAVITGCAVTGATARLELRGTLEKSAATGTVDLLRENNEWRVSKESWNVQMDSPAAPAEPPPAAPMPDAVRKIVDRIASAKPDEGAVAWTELGARYQGASAFLAQVRPALSDDRPVAFVMVEESFKGNGAGFRYYTAKGSGAGAKTFRAATVGEALRYHLWQYEDVSNSGFKGSFKEWWPTYAGPRGLPVFP